MKRVLMGSVAVGVLSMATAALASMTIRYDNKDSKAYQAAVV
jgi:hypothetical protein